MIPSIRILLWFPPNHILLKTILWAQNVPNVINSKNHKQNYTDFLQITLFVKLSPDPQINQTKYYLAYSGFIIHNSLILWPNLNYRKLLLPSYYLSLIKNNSTSCFNFLAHMNPTLFSDPILQAVILHLSFLYVLCCWYLLYQVS